MKIGVILDASGSMECDALRVIDGVNEYFTGLKADENTKDAELTMASFNGDIGVKMIRRNVVVKALPDLTQNEYRCRGTTPLYDAIGQVIGVMDRAAVEGEKVLCLIQTDGHENSSKEFNRFSIAALIKEMEAKGTWTFVFLGANLDAWDAQSQMGLGMSAGNTVSYDGIQTSGMMRSMAAATSAYAANTAKSTDQFWSGDSKHSESLEGYVAPADAAASLGVSKSTLQRMRSSGQGPAYAKLGERTVRYSKRDINEWTQAVKKTTGN